MSFDHAKDIYMKVGSMNHIKVIPLLVYDPSKEVNASYGGMRVTINQGMLADVRDDDEIALVFGHELAHYTLAHNASTPAHEYAADALGAIYMHNAGYNICIGAQVIKRFHAPDSDTHPNSDSRFKRICHS